MSAAVDFLRQAAIEAAALELESERDPLAFYQFKSDAQRQLVEFVGQEIECYWRSGNQGGKTYGGAALAVALARGETSLGGMPIPKIRTPNVGWVLVRTYKSQVDGAQAAVLALIGKYPHKISWLNRGMDVIGVVRIKPKGCESNDPRHWSRIMFHCGETRGRSLPGGRIDWAWADEPPPIKLWREVRARRRRNAPFYRFITATPLDRSEWVELEEDFKESHLEPKYGRVLIRSRVYDNSALSDEHIAALENEWKNDPHLLARLNGDLVDASGLCPFKDSLLALGERSVRRPTSVATVVRREALDGTKLPPIEVVWEQYAAYDPGEWYYLDIDPASGIKSPLHDPCELHLYARCSDQLVARFNGFLDPYSLGWLAASIADRYGGNDVLADIEMNDGYGRTVLRGMRDFGHTNFSVEAREDKTTGQVSNEIGWKTTVANRPAFVGFCHEVLETGAIKIPAAGVWATLRGVVIDKTGKVLAKDGRHDEAMILLGRFGYMRGILGKPSRREVALEQTTMGRTLEAMFGRPVLRRDPIKEAADGGLFRPRSR